MTQTGTLICPTYAPDAIYQRWINLIRYSPQQPSNPDTNHSAMFRWANAQKTCSLGGGILWAAAATSGYNGLLRTDLTTGAGTYIQTPTGASVTAASETAVFVGSASSGDVYKYNLDGSPAPSSYIVAQSERGSIGSLYYDGERVFCIAVTTPSNGLSVINPQNGGQVEFQLGTNPPTRQQDISQTAVTGWISADKSEALLALYAGTTVELYAYGYESATGDEMPAIKPLVHKASITVSGYPINQIAFGTDGQSVYIANHGNTISKYAATGGTPTVSQHIGKNVYSVVAMEDSLAVLSTEDGGSLWVSDIYSLDWNLAEAPDLIRPLNRAQPALWSSTAYPPLPSVSAEEAEAAKSEHD